jgi:hypothetical protein
MSQAAAQYVRQGIRVSSDPLGYGLAAWRTQVQPSIGSKYCTAIGNRGAVLIESAYVYVHQWLGEWADGVREQLVQKGGMALDIRSGMQVGDSRTRVSRRIFEQLA